MALCTFKRYEKKYLVNSIQKSKLEEMISDKMVPDKYCMNGQTYLVQNIYYDSIDNHLISLSCMKPDYKEKVRARMYGTNSQTTFLEIKKKVEGIVSKRRVKISCNMMDDFIQNGVKPSTDDFLSNQIINEIDYINKNYHLEKKVYIRYDRIAYYGIEDSTLRLTFDHNIEARRDQLEFDAKGNNISLLPEGTFLLEIKVSSTVPLWLANALSELKIYSCSFSKYGFEYKKYCLNKDDIVNKTAQVANVIQTREDNHKWMNYLVQS